MVERAAAAAGPLSGRSRAGAWTRNSFSGGGVTSMCGQRPRPREVVVRSVVSLICVTFAAFVFSAGGGAIRGLHGNNFYVNCRFSHTADDDPIVYPGQPGKSHPHTFFGNRSTRADSTLASLRTAGTTCKPRADRAAYWVPTLFQDGREIRPAKGQFYYNLRGFDEMRTFPAGLKMIAGDAHAEHPQSARVTYWTCGGGGGVRTARSTTAPEVCPVVRARFNAFVRKCPTCPRVKTVFTARVKTFLELHVNFPDCWDGRRLDSPDHKDHMAYSRQYVCPESHPVKVPLIRVVIRYPITDGRGVSLASGGQLTGHADFFNAWDQHALARLVDDCFHDRPCNDPRARARRAGGGGRAPAASGASGPSGLRAPRSSESPPARRR
jgi:Domain of unknown function (DUF1996)